MRTSDLSRRRRRARRLRAIPLPLFLEYLESRVLLTVSLTPGWWGMAVPNSYVVETNFPGGFAVLAEALHLPVQEVSNVGGGLAYEFIAAASPAEVYTWQSLYKNHIQSLDPNYEFTLDDPGLPRIPLNGTLFPIQQSGDNTAPVADDGGAAANWQGNVVPNSYIISTNFPGGLTALADQRNLPVQDVTDLGGGGAYSFTTTASPDEVYAWKSQFSTDIQDLSPNYIVSLDDHFVRSPASNVILQFDEEVFVTWGSSAGLAVNNSYLIQTNEAGGLVALANQLQLPINNIKFLGGTAGYSFMTTATPAEVFAWQGQYSDQIQSIEPNYVVSTNDHFSLGNFVPTAISLPNIALPTDPISNPATFVSWGDGGGAATPNAYVVKTTNPGGFTAVANALHLPILNVLDLGGGGSFAFTTTASPSDVFAWQSAYSDDIASVSPDYVVYIETPSPQGTIQLTETTISRLPIYASAGETNGAEISLDSSAAPEALNAFDGREDLLGPANQ